MVWLKKKTRKLTQASARTIAEFIITFGLIPQNLITPEVLDLINKSWQREDVLNCNPAQKKVTNEFLRVLYTRSFRRKPKKILQDMQPVNFNTLFDNL